MKLRTKLKILIIEDNEPDRLLLKSRLRKNSFDIEVLEASTAAEGLELMSSHDDLDCTFLDYMLPDMDGITLLKKIYNESTGLGPCPIVMLTGQGNEAVVMDAISYGAQDYMVKECISTDTLHVALTKARQSYDVQASRNEAITMLDRAQKMSPSEKLTKGMAHDFDNLLTIISGDTSALIEVLQTPGHDPQACIEKAKKLNEGLNAARSLLTA